MRSSTTWYRKCKTEGSSRCISQCIFSLKGSRPLNLSMPIISWRVTIKTSISFPKSKSTTRLCRIGRSTWEKCRSVMNSSKSTLSSTRSWSDWDRKRTCRTDWKSCSRKMSKPRVLWRAFPRITTQTCTLKRWKSSKKKKRKEGSSSSKDWSWSKSTERKQESWIKWRIQRQAQRRRAMWWVTWLRSNQTRMRRCSTKTTWRSWEREGWLGEGQPRTEKWATT